jgi:hypothetical protein
LAIYGKILEKCVGTLLRFEPVILGSRFLTNT